MYFPHCTVRKIVCFVSENSKSGTCHVKTHLIATEVFDFRGLLEMRSHILFITQKRNSISVKVIHFLNSLPTDEDFCESQSFLKQLTYR